MEAKPQETLQQLVAWPRTRVSPEGEVKLWTRPVHTPTTPTRRCEGLRAARGNCTTCFGAKVGPLVARTARGLLARAPGASDETLRVIRTCPRRKAVSKRRPAEAGGPRSETGPAREAPCQQNCASPSYPCKSQKGTAPQARKPSNGK